MADEPEMTFGAGIWREHRLACALFLAAALLLLWLALAPLHLASRERALSIAAGDPQLPAVITLTLGVQDVLLLRNVDKLPQHIGPVPLAPGQQLRLPFEQVGEFQIAAGAWPGGVLTVRVVEWPAPGWDRLAWRVAALVHAVRYWPIVPSPRADRATASAGSGIMRP